MTINTNIYILIYQCNTNLITTVLIISLLPIKIHISFNLILNFTLNKYK